MLSKENRLSRIEIEELKAKKIVLLQGRFFGLIFQKQKGVSKFALIVSNKISNKATIRNKIKRLFFKAVENKLLRSKLAQYPVKAGKFDSLSPNPPLSDTASRNKFFGKEGKFLFLAKKSCLPANLEDFEEEVESFKSRLERE